MTEQEENFPTELTDDLKSFLDMCETKFANRYTNDDEEFMFLYNKDVSPPPIVPDWNPRIRPRNQHNRNHDNYNRHHRGGGDRNNYHNHHRRNNYDSYNNYRRRAPDDRGYDSYNNERARHD